MRIFIYNNKPSYESVLGCFLMCYVFYLIFLINFEGQWLQHLWILTSIIFSYCFLVLTIVGTTIYEDSILITYPTKIWDKRRIVFNENICKVKYSHGVKRGSQYPFFRIYYNNETGAKIIRRAFNLHKHDDPLILLNHFKNLNIPIDFYTEYEEEKKWEKEFKTVK